MTLPAGAAPDPRPRVRPWRHPWVRHLRIGFNLTLAPLFLWGLWLAGGPVADGRIWLAFVALHVFLYGGTTAFNSAFDRDEGPVGGMAEPPPVDRGLVWWALAVQAAGLPLAAAVGAPFLTAYLALFVVATAYSHPAVRLKARPLPALLAVTLGQGGLGFLAGWWAAAPRGSRVPWSDLGEPTVLLGAAVAAATLAGLYVVSQAYQTDEDARRGDRTLAVVFGPACALRAGLAATLAGAALMGVMVFERAGAVWAALPPAGAVALAVPWWAWAARFDPAAVRENFRSAMRIAIVAGAALGTFLLVLLLLG